MFAADSDDETRCCGCNVLLLTSKYPSYMRRLSEELPKLIERFKQNSSSFTHEDDLTTWISSECLGMQFNGRNIAIPYLIYELSKTTIEYKNGAAYKKFFYENVKRGEPGIKIYPTIIPIELPFLQYVHQVSKRKEHIVTLELGAGLCYVSSKVPLAYVHEGIHYANDLSFNLLNSECSKKRIHRRLGSQSIQRIAGDCFKLFRHKKYSHIQGTVDVLYAQNIETSFNPAQHEQFIQLIRDLLAPGGRAYLCAQAYQFKEVNGVDLFFDHYLERIENETEVYNGYVSIKKSDNRITLSRPISDTVPIKTEYSILHSRGRGKAQKIKGISIKTQHRFFKNTYERSYGAYPELTVLETFYCDYEKDSRRDIMKGAQFVAAVIEKKADPV